MEIRHIQYFVALYEERSITRAAQRLHVVQPAVSMQIRNLEAEFGVQLFDRTFRGVTPTETADLLYPACLKILAGVADARTLLQALSGEIAGTVRVGVPPSLAAGVFGAVLSDFTREYPKVHIRCHEGYSANLMNWLSQGLLDFAVVNMPEAEKGLRMQELASERFVAVGRKNGALRRRSQIRGVDIVKCRLVLPSPRNLIRICLEREFEKAGLKVNPALEVDSLAVVLTLLQSEDWVSILPNILFRNSALTRSFAVAGLVEPTVETALVVASPASSELSIPARKLVDALERTLKAT